MKHNFVIVGCGGVASYLLPVLSRTYPDENYLFVDGDTLEPRNLDRQLFRPEDVGKNKAEALASLYSNLTRTPTVVPHYLSPSLPLPLNEDLPSIYFVCADNHAARRSALEFVDRDELLLGKAIIGGNEYTDAEAYYYEASWKGTSLDPRVYYPEITTDTSDDPLRPEGCTGAGALKAHPQLAIANHMAAAYMLHLLWFYLEEAPKMAEEIIPHFPLRHGSNFSMISTTRQHQHEIAR